MRGTRQAPQGDRPSPLWRDVLVWSVTLGTLGCGGAEARRAGDRTRETTAREWATDSMARVRQDSINRQQPGYVIDSILPIDEALRRFRRGLPDPRAFEGGASTREALVTAFVRALEARDTTALRRLQMTRAEFAWLVYPSSPFVAPPYRQAPELVWLQLATASEKGYRRLVERLGGRALPLRGVQCEVEPERQGENRIWRRCAVRLGTGALDAGPIRLFGDIIERRGRFKFASYANDL